MEELNVVVSDIPEGFTFDYEEGNSAGTMFRFKDDVDGWLAIGRVVPVQTGVVGEPIDLGEQRVGVIHRFAGSIRAEMPDSDGTTVVVSSTPSYEELAISVLRDIVTNS